MMNIIKKLSSRVISNPEERENFEALAKIFNNTNIQALIQVHEKVQWNGNQIKSESENSLHLVKGINEFAGIFSDNKDLLRLLTLLQDPHVLSLLDSYDKVSTKDYDVPHPSRELDEDVDNFDVVEESMKVVRLVKNDEPLGATISTDATGNIVIARILKGGAADRSGLIHVNDVLVEVNNISAKGKTPKEIIKVLSGVRGPLIFKLIPGQTPDERKDEELFVRCRFNFRPNIDPLIPCKEAGLSFDSGDILKIVAKDDISWWQASKIESSRNGKIELRAGIIPSLKLQLRREKLKKQMDFKMESPSIKGSNLSLLSQDKKTTWKIIRRSFRKKRRDTTFGNSFTQKKTQSSKVITPYFPPYEVVSPFIPHGTNVYRPIVLVGPQGVGRNQLKDLLIDSNPSHFGVPIPHTSRVQQADEEHGKDYHFVTREYMEASIRDNLFLEYGEYRGNLYGTSVDAVRNVVKCGQVCILTPYPQALCILRTKELKPFIIFLKPPPFDDMTTPGADNETIRAKLTLERDGHAPLTGDELKDLVRRGEKMEAGYGRLFDITIVNGDLNSAFDRLKEISFYLENDRQWMPSNWLS